MNKVYTNYLSGSVYQVSSCLEIILFNKFSFSEKISLYNLKDFYLKYLVGSSESYVRLVRESPSTFFEYKKSLSAGFNIILYISSVSNSPIGYTEFINTQGVGVSLGIEINISRTLVNEFTIVLKNGLVENDLTKVYTGKELYNYSTRNDIVSRKYRNLFTSDIGRLESDIYSFIVSSSGLITKEYTWKLDINKDVVISSSLGYNNICFYKGDLVIACWDQMNYSLYPLIGNSSIISGTTTYNIGRIEGRYYRDTIGTLRDLETGSEVIMEKDTQFCDFLNPKCTVYDLPVFYSISDIFKYIPEINNIYLDLNYYLKSNQVRIQSKIGSWYIMSREYGGTIIFIAVSPTTMINMTEEDLEKAIFVGDQTMILCEDNYYSVFNSFSTELSTERARVILEGGRLDKWTILEDSETGDDNFWFCYLDTDEDEKHFEEYYGGDDSLVHLVFKNEELSNTVLNKYRKNIYPEIEGIPELLGSFKGIIFYKIDNKVSYL